MENSTKQCHSTTVENRFFINLQNQGSSGSSSVIFNPDEGVGGVILTLQLPAPQGAVTYNGCALNKGWGYSLIRRIGVRYGGSTLYYFTGAQMLIDNLSDCEDSQKRDVLYQLGGQALMSASGGGAGDFADAGKRTAWCYLKLPHNSPSAQEKPLPLPTDLLTAPVQLNIEFNNFADVFQTSATVAAPAAVSAIPATLDVARVQFEQVHFDDRGEQLARRHNMSDSAYSYPLKYFAQETFSVQNVPGGSEFPVTLTGLRSGNCIGIRIWCKAQGDPNPFNYVTPNSIRLSVNGLIYFDSSTGESQLWNLVERKTSASWNSDVLSGSGAAWVDTPSVSTWTWVPFAQHSEVLANENELSNGLAIMNSIVNLTVNLPAGSTYTVTAEYIFNSTLLFTRGSCDYVF